MPAIAPLQLCLPIRKSDAYSTDPRFTFPDHELAIGKLAEEVGFDHISLSSQLLPMIRMVPRGVSTTADAYLTPVLKDYLDGFYAGFEKGRDGDLNVEFMGSDGGLVDLTVSPDVKEAYGRTSLAYHPSCPGQLEVW